MALDKLSSKVNKSSHLVAMKSVCCGAARRRASCVGNDIEAKFYAILFVHARTLSYVRATPIFQCAVHVCVFVCVGVRYKMH